MVRFKKIFYLAAIFNLAFLSNITCIDSLQFNETELSTEFQIDAANKAYQAYMNFFLTKDKKYLKDFYDSSECKKTRQFVNYSKYYSAKKIKNIYTFGRELKIKLSNKEQIIKDFAISNEDIIKKLDFILINNQIYFHALKSFGIGQLFLDILYNELNTEQKRIIGLAKQVCKCYLDNLIKATPTNKTAIDNNIRSELDKLIDNPLFVKIKTEWTKAIKVKTDDISKFEKAIPNFRLFDQAIQIKMTDRAGIYRRYNFASKSEDSKEFFNLLLVTFNIDYVLEELGFIVDNLY